LPATASIGERDAIDHTVIARAAREHGQPRVRTGKPSADRSAAAGVVFERVCTSVVLTVRATLHFSGTNR
jgi:hypothetical protein